jgi:hypothetical protein
VFALFEALNRNLDMTAILPPIVCRYPFANDELAAFCNDVEAELEAKAKELAARAAQAVDLSWRRVRVMKDFLRRRQLEESGRDGRQHLGGGPTRRFTPGTRTTTTRSTPFSCRDFQPATRSGCCSATSTSRR